MNLLTLVGALPLVGAALIYLIPTKDSELVKKFALLVTSLVAIAAIFLAVGFDKSITSLQYAQSLSLIHI